jgi:hypothetical protein
MTLQACAPSLERELRRQAEQSESAHSLRADGSGKMLLVRVLPAGEANDTLVYLEDLDRIHQPDPAGQAGRTGAPHRQYRPRDPQSPGVGVRRAAELLREERSEMQGV